MCISCAVCDCGRGQHRQGENLRDQRGALQDVSPWGEYMYVTMRTGVYAHTFAEGIILRLSGFLFCSIITLLDFNSSFLFIRIWKKLVCWFSPTSKMWRVVWLLLRFPRVFSLHLSKTISGTSRPAVLSLEKGKAPKTYRATLKICYTKIQLNVFFFFFHQ